MSGTPPPHGQFLHSLPKRRGYRLLFLAFTFISVLYFSLYISHLDSPKSVYHRPKKTNSQDIENTNPRKVSFEESVKRKFNQIAFNPERFYVAFTEDIEAQIQFDFTHFSKQTEDKHSWINRDTLFYDPRFTLSMYLNALKLEYQRLNNQDETNEIILPFHWADWIDLTLLNDELSKPLHLRKTCSYIQSVTFHNPDPKHFCFSNSELSKDEVTRLGYKSSTQLPGFIIHDHCMHRDKAFNDDRVLQAKSHAMTYLKKPISVIILNGTEGTYEFTVDQESNQRLVSSNLIERYITSNKLKNLKQVTLNHLELWENIQSIAKPTYLDPDDPGYELYTSMKSIKEDQTNLIQFPLNKDMFTHPEPIKQQIEALDRKRLENGLSLREQVYYQSMVDCDNYPDRYNNREFRYFRMPTIRVEDKRNHGKDKGWHYDWRFFNGALNYETPGWTQQEQEHRANIILDRLLRSWYRFATQKGFVSWIYHGPILSWYWNGMMFPFDNDIDIQMPISEVIRLAKYYNNTLVVEDPTEGYGKYLIDVIPYVHHRQLSKSENYIDARFIDVDSGLYIDITALSKSKAELPAGLWETGMGKLKKDKKDKNDKVEIYNERRKHFYELDELSPLRYTMLSGIPVFIPPKIIFRMSFAYRDGLSSYEFGGWYFVDRLNLWIKEQYFIPLFKFEEITMNGMVESQKLLDKVMSMTDDQVLRLLENDEILTEYYLTKNLTELHSQEIKYLFDDRGRDNIWLSKNQDSVKKYNELTKEFKLGKPLRKSLYYYENIERLKHKEK
ncbi:uncharacterized protein J8A68_003087 [[Candida] subhashii]|uniref:LicD/FKTN/FKRP nucleotidyltransferase domain-containing protein n=1 Tax=[Candida] subhashii TaxID=561895 RepID=A0A8J5QN63_9ASCO|nr:uncharacterized protein J8A68_003087 [[Candida] subhashii]KAG7663435.1 hypothetical protein J8A68_003087 [[Candida] subhashii]